MGSVKKIHGIGYASQPDHQFRCDGKWGQPEWAGVGQTQVGVLKPLWWIWQTRNLEVVVSERTGRFDPCQRH